MYKKIFSSILFLFIFIIHQSFSTVNISKSAALPPVTFIEIVAFDFEDSVKRSQTNFVNKFYTADRGISKNKDIAEIKYKGISSSNFSWYDDSGNMALAVKGWKNGVGVKSFTTKFSTVGYKDLKLSYDLGRSGFGPRDFKVQWKIDDEIGWQDVLNSEIELDYSGGGIFNNIIDLPLPSELNNTPNVELRWVLTSNISGEMTNIETGEVSYIIINDSGEGVIDNIVVKGEPDPEATEYNIKDGLIAYWPFDNNANDYSGNNNHGVNHGAVLTSGKVNNAYDFEAEGAYISVPQSNTLKTGIIENDFSISFWGMFPSTDDVSVISQSPGPNNVKKWMFAVQGGALQFHSWDEYLNDRHFAVDAFNYFVTSEFAHYVLVKEGDSWKLYKDAILRGSSYNEPIELSDLGMDFEIARAESDFYYKDVLDELTIWGRALSEYEISYLYNDGDGESLMFFILEYLSDSNGKITGENIQTVNFNENGTAVKAVADEGFYFVNWSDGSTDNPRTDLNVSRDISVTANFAKITSTGNDNKGVAGGRDSDDIAEGQQTSSEDDVDSEATEEEEPEDKWLPFIDIEGHWAEDIIVEIYNYGLIDGYENKEFKPDRKINRAEAVKIISRWFNEEIKESDCIPNIYKDVECSKWYGKYVGFLTKKGVIHGYEGEGLFKPESNITIAEVLKIIVYAKELKDIDLQNIENKKFSSFKQDWFYKVLLIAHKYEMIPAIKDDNFNPNVFVLRAEFVKYVKDLLY